MWINLGDKENFGGAFSENLAFPEIFSKEFGIFREFCIYIEFSR